MRRLLWLALLQCAVLPAGSQTLSPTYTAAGIVNSATFSNELAPNSIATIFGQNLSYDIVAIATTDVRGGTLPITLGGVQIFMALERAHPLYVSPTQINFLVPSNLRAGELDLVILRDGTAGATVRVTVRDIAPGLYRNAAGEVAATRTDPLNPYITAESPAHSGDVVILWATGLGHTDPDPIYGEVATRAAQLRQLSNFVVTLDGQPLPASSILYAGVTPAYAGLYQINLRLPAGLPPNPEVRVGLTGQLSPAGSRIPLQ